MFLKFLISIALPYFLATSASFAQDMDPPPNSVTDPKTGLIWQKCSRGVNDDANCSGAATTETWAEAIIYCATLEHTGKPWRLPTINELKTLVDTTKLIGAAIDTTAFPATVAGYYWSSTT